MLVASVVLALGISVDVDLRALINLVRREGDQPRVTCRINVVGYHFAGRPGQQFEYAGETFTIPGERFVEVIALPHVTHYAVAGRRLPLNDGFGALDPFSFRWITLPRS
jgi:hypothetical protein